MPEEGNENIISGLNSALGNIDFFKNLADGGMDLNALMGGILKGGGLRSGSGIDLRFATPDPLNQKQMDYIEGINRDYMLPQILMQNQNFYDRFNQVNRLNQEKNIYNKMLSGMGNPYANSPAFSGATGMTPFGEPTPKYIEEKYPEFKAQNPLPLPPFVPNYISVGMNKNGGITVRGNEKKEEHFIPVTYWQDGSEGKSGTFSNINIKPNTSENDWKTAISKTTLWFNPNVTSADASNYMRTNINDSHEFTDGGTEATKRAWKRYYVESGKLKSDNQDGTYGGNQDLIQSLQQHVIGYMNKYPNSIAAKILKKFQDTQASNDTWYSVNKKSLTDDNNGVRSYGASAKRFRSAVDTVVNDFIEKNYRSILDPAIMKKVENDKEWKNAHTFKKGMELNNLGGYLFSSMLGQ